eukprot:Gb_37910 [translate_table: standard]
MHRQMKWGMTWSLDTSIDEWSRKIPEASQKMNRRQGDK